jgi:hypothetical protein
MPEDQDKKISYKILTAEELLKEKAPPVKEIEHKEEKIEIPIAQKIEGPKASEVVLPDIQSETKPMQEEPSKEEIFYIPQKDKEISFKSKSEPLQEEAEKKDIPEVNKGGFKLPTNLLRFVFLGGGIILIFLLLFFLKPQEKKKEEETKITTPTKTVISFPTITPIISAVTTSQKKEITTSEKEIATGTPVISLVTSTQLQIPSQPEISPASSEIKFLANYYSKEITLKNLDFLTWQEEFKKFLSLQEFSGTKINVNFLYNKNKIPLSFLFDYFIKTTKISSEKIKEFRDNLTGSYGFLIYYGYTRRYPILIFEIKDKEKALKFNQEWEKSTMKENLKTLFLGLEPPKTKNNFVTKKQRDYSYRILDFGDNFKIIWSVADDYLIYSTTEIGLKDIFNLFQ